MNASKIQQLAATGQKVFHTQDLARIWGITNANTLYKTASRYSANSAVLSPIHKGLYSLIDPADLDPRYLIAAALPFYSYFSGESVLAEHGAIFQKIEYRTLMGERSTTGTLAGHSYKVRQLKDEYLFNNLGIEQHSGYKQATLSRAVADLLYFNPSYHVDNRDKIDWLEVATICQQVYGKSI